MEALSEDSAIRTLKILQEKSSLEICPDCHEEWSFFLEFIDDEEIIPY